MRIIHYWYRADVLVQDDENLPPSELVYGTLLSHKAEIPGGEGDYIRSVHARRVTRGKILNDPPTKQREMVGLS